MEVSGLDQCPDLRELSDADLDAALDLCRMDVAASILAAQQIEQARQVGIAASGGQLWGYPRVGRLRAVVWVGTNIVPVDPLHAPDFAQAVAGGLRVRNRPLSSLVGPRDTVLEIWRYLAPHWVAPREVRDLQYSMVISQAPRIAPSPEVRRATAVDYTEVFPACVAMFNEEIGYSPLAVSPHGYPQRVRWLIESGLSWILPQDEPTVDIPVQFKAEVGAQFESMVQLQGVWVAPPLRGRGIGTAAIAGVVAHLQSQGFSVGLYVNAYNHAALSVYTKVGFEVVGQYATVLF